MEANLLLPDAWDTGGVEVTRAVVIRGDVDKCGRRCTLDAGANAVRRRVLYINVPGSSTAAVVVRWGEGGGR